MTISLLYISLHHMGLPQTNMRINYSAIVIPFIITHLKQLSTIKDSLIIICFIQIEKTNFPKRVFVFRILFQILQLYINGIIYVFLRL